MTISEEKQAQRAAPRAARKALDAPQRAAANAALCRRVLELDAYRTAHTLLLYAAFGGEASLAAVAAEAARAGQDGGLPGVRRGLPLPQPCRARTAGRWDSTASVRRCRSALPFCSRSSWIWCWCPAPPLTQTAAGWAWARATRPLPAPLHPGGEDWHCIGSSARPPRHRGRPRPAAGRLCNREGMYTHGNERFKLRTVSGTACQQSAHAGRRHGRAGGRCRCGAG